MDTNSQINSRNIEEIVKGVLARLRGDFHSEMHIDTDDANCAGLKNGNTVTILAKKGKA